MPKSRLTGPFSIHNCDKNSNNFRCLSDKAIEKATTKGNLQDILINKVKSCDNCSKLLNISISNEGIFLKQLNIGTNKLTGDNLNEVEHDSEEKLYYQLKMNRKDNLSLALQKINLAEKFLITHPIQREKWLR
nr:11079_t:CDS:2 [Entrophospora candida]